MDPPMLNISYIPTADNSSDLFTKSNDGATFEKHAKEYCGNDEYYKNWAEEGVEMRHWRLSPRKYSIIIISVRDIR